MPGAMWLGAIVPGAKAWDFALGVPPGLPSLRVLAPTLGVRGEPETTTSPSLVRRGNCESATRATHGVDAECATVATFASACVSASS